jgi:hypothetical protein
MSNCQDLSFRLESLCASSEKWDTLIRHDPRASLFHSNEWLSFLGQAFGMTLFLATIERGSTVVAGVVFARSKNPLSRTLIALPFSDSCEPLSVIEDGVPMLLNALSNNLSRCEIRGTRGGIGWETISCFDQWSIDLMGKDPAAKTADGGVRRKIRRAREAGVEIASGNTANLLERYYALHARTRHRLGIPSQGRHFFGLLQKTLPFDSLTVWLAIHKGIDVAGLILLRHKEEIHYRWGARLPSAPNGAQHLLISELVNKYEGTLKKLHLGRTDNSNLGLRQFKKEVGGVPELLPYSFYPRAPRHVSPEALTGARRQLSSVWKYLPFNLVEMLGGALYPYLA